MTSVRYAANPAARTTLVWNALRLAMAVLIIAAVVAAAAAQTALSPQVAGMAAQAIGQLQRRRSERRTWPQQSIWSSDVR